MQIQLSSGNYRIVDSGQAFLFDADADFKLHIRTDDQFAFSVVLKFENDASEGHRIEQCVDGNVITAICYNFADNGTGLQRPVPIAQIEGKDLFLMFWSYLEGEGKVRSVKYTVFMDSSEGEHADGE